MPIKTGSTAARTAATSTMALLGTLGVAQAQTLEFVGPTSLDSSAAYRVGTGGVDTVGVATPGLIGFESAPLLPAVSGLFWCRDEGTLTESAGLSSTTITDVSSTGSYACGWESSAGGVRWTKDGSPVAIIGPEFTTTYPLAISADGTTIVGTGEHSPSGTTVPFIWTEATGEATPLPVDTISYAHASAVSADGTIVAGMSIAKCDDCEKDGGGPGPYAWRRWVDGTMETLPVLGEVRGMSPSGNVIVGRDASGEAVALIDGVLHGMGIGGYALGASDDGVVVGTDTTQTRAWRWTDSEGLELMDSLFEPKEGVAGPTAMLVATDAGACGDVIVGWAGEPSTVEFGDAPDGPLAAWTVTPAGSISGTIDGINGSDGRDAWIINIIDPDRFYATTSDVVDPRAFADFDTRLWLFNIAEIVIANDDGPGGMPYRSTLSDPADFSALTGGPVAPSSPASIAPGNYVLVISGWDDNPLDSTGTPMADLDSAFDTLHGPASGTGPFASWDTSGHSAGSYTIALSGVAPDVSIKPSLTTGFVVTFSHGPDSDGDGHVAFTDLLTLLSSWGECMCCPSDLNRDGVVDFVDLLSTLSAWGPVK